MMAGYFEKYYIETYEGKLSIVEFEGDEESLVIPFVIDGQPMNSIYDYAFNIKTSSNLRRVEVPASVAFDEKAFHEGVQVVRYFSKEMEGFEHEGTWVTNPYKDTTGRFDVDPLEYYGIKVLEDEHEETMQSFHEIQEEQELIERAEKETFQELNGFSDEENELISWKYGNKAECCRCEKEVNLANKEEYEYDFVGELWCKPCMEQEMQRDS